MEVAAWELLLIQLLNLPAGAGLLPQLLQLGLAAVNPNELVRLGHGRHLVNPCQYARLLVNAMKVSPFCDVMQKILLAVL